MTRRAALALGALTGLAGCQSLGGGGDDGSSADGGDGGTTRRDTEGTDPSAPASASTTTGQVGQYFNDDGELTAPVNNDRVDTGAVSSNVAAGPELVAYRDGETATVADGRSREVLYAGDDIGAIVNELQEEFPAGVHLHLTDLFEYSTNIVVSTPMKLTGERAVTNFSRRGADALEVDPVGLRFTGSGVAVQCFNGTKGVRGLHVEDLFVHAESGTTAFQLRGQYGGGTDGYSPWADSIFHNVVTEGGSEAGFEVVGTHFNNTFGDIRAFGSGGHGIWIHPDEEGIKGGLSTFNLLRAKFCDGDGVRIEGMSHTEVNRVYVNFCKGRGVYLGSDVVDNHYHRVFGEVNEGPDVEVAELLNGRIDVLVGKGGEPTPPAIDYRGPSVRVGLFNGSIGRVNAKDGDFVLDGMRAGSVIEDLRTQNGASIDVEDAGVFDSEIRQIHTTDGVTYRFNEATLTDDQERGTVRFEFDTRFNEPPTLSFGRRAGGIADVEYNKTSADGQFWSADIELVDPGGTVDVKAHMSRQV